LASLPEQVTPQTPWPTWPNILRTSSSHEEGCARGWCVLTKKFTGTDDTVSELHGCEVQWAQTDGDWKMKEIPATEFTLKVDLVLLAMGFVHVAHSGTVEELGLELDPRGNVVVDESCVTCAAGVFAAGDTYRLRWLISLVKSPKDRYESPWVQR